VCSASDVCMCKSGYSASVASCAVVQEGSYPSESIAYSSGNLDWRAVAASTDFRTMVATVWSDQKSKSLQIVV